MLQAIEKCSPTELIQLKEKIDSLNAFLTSRKVAFSNEDIEVPDVKETYIFQLFEKEYSVMQSKIPTFCPNILNEKAFQRLKLISSCDTECELVHKIQILKDKGQLIQLDQSDIESLIPK